MPGTDLASERGMSLSPEQSTELRRALDERRGALVREIREDQAHARRDIGELHEIDAARERMADGRYGECLECGQDIGYARLKANPSALRCIVCQTRLEKSHGSGAPTL